MKWATLIAAGLLLTGCQGDETLRAYGAADKIWQVVELHGAAFAATATIAFPEEGRIRGKGPCNGYSATQDVPYPWFKAGPILATRMACPALAAESAYFNALSAATLSEVAGNTLILSNEDAVLLVFKSAD